MAKPKFDRIMRILIPYLIQQRMQEQYLKRSYGEAERLARLKDVLSRRYQKEIQDRASENAIKLELIKTGRVGVEDLDRPLDELLYRLGQAGVTHPAIPTISPEIIEERRSPFGNTMARISAALEKAKYLPSKEIAPATGLLGSKRVMDFLKEAGKERAGKEERRLREEGFKVEREKIALEEEKLKAKKVKTPEEKRKELKEKEKRLFSLKEKIAKPEEDVTTKQIQLWKSEVEILKEDINRLKKETGEKTDEEYRALATELNRRGLASKAEDIDKNRELRQSLIAQGYNVARLKKFFK